MSGAGDAALHHLSLSAAKSARMGSKIYDPCTAAGGSLTTENSPFPKSGTKVALARKYFRLEKKRSECQHRAVDRDVILASRVVASNCATRPRLQQVQSIFCAKTYSRSWYL